jgi:hypothetical protein
VTNQVVQAGSYWIRRSDGTPVRVTAASPRIFQVACRDVVFGLWGDVTQVRHVSKPRRSTGHRFRSDHDYLGDDATTACVAAERWRRTEGARK